MTPADADRRARAGQRLARLMGWVLLIAALAVAAVLIWLKAIGTPLRIATVIAVIAGVGLSIVLGAGLMLLIFYSDASGIDAEAAEPFEEPR